MTYVVWMLVVASSAWVYWDASAHKVGKRQGETGAMNMSAGALAAVSLGFWIIGFPAYLIKRNKLIAAAQQQPVVSKYRAAKLLLILSLGGAVMVALPTEPVRAPVAKPTTVAAAQSKPAPIEPKLPDHFYSVADGYDYAYESEISSNERDAGLTTKPMVMVRYLGTYDGLLQIAEIENQYLTSIMDCRDPCEVVRMRVFSGGRMMSKDFIKADQGSILLYALSDASRHKMTRYLNESGKALYYDDVNHRKIVDP